MSRKKIKRKRSRRREKSQTIKYGYRVGEVMELGSPALFPRGFYRIESVDDQYLTFSVGEIRGMLSPDLVEIYQRNVTKPIDWELEEINFLEFSSSRCNCDECRAQLAKKKAARAEAISEAVLVH